MAVSDGARSAHHRGYTAQARDPGPHTGAETARAHWVNAFVFEGETARVHELIRRLRTQRSVAWRPARDVERESIVHLTRNQGLSTMDATLDDVLQGARYVEDRYDIRGGALQMRWQRMWMSGVQQCRDYMRGLLAELPGASIPVSNQIDPNSITLASVLVPPLRVLRASYEYVGREWCLERWGTPEDMRVLRSVDRSTNGRGLVAFLAQTVDGHPIPAFAHLARQETWVTITVATTDLSSGGIVVNRFSRDRSTEVTSRALLRTSDRQNVEDQVLDAALQGGQ